MRLGAGVFLVFGALAGLSGCRVDTKVSVVDRGGGHGTVTVTVVLDRQAVDALGGETGLARQLSVGDLRSAGWEVTGPVPTPGVPTGSGGAGGVAGSGGGGASGGSGGTGGSGAGRGTGASGGGGVGGTGGGGGATLTASHGFSSSSEAARLLAELAGSGTAANRPFRLSIVSQSGFLHVHDTMVGKVDLTCELSCFGDQGLQSALGNANGVATAPLLNQSGERPDQLFGFTLSARMPGKVQSENAPTRNRSDLTWTTPLGQVTEISAESESLNTRNIVVVSVVGGVGIAGSVTALIFRRRRRGRAKNKHARHRRIWPFRRRDGTNRAESEKVDTG